MGGRSRHGHMPGLREPRVHLVLLAPIADLPDGPAQGLACRDRLPFAEQFHEVGQLVPPSGQESAVPSAGATATDVALQDGHTDPRVVVDQEIGRPHAGVAAAQDDHVRRDRSVERRALLTGLGGERFPEPPGPPAPGGRGAFPDPRLGHTGDHGARLVTRPS
ncbi:MAG TPA: hypothetical protein VEM93_01690 [Actinomycetota bacterium]|nr:hypothetical protein [Actinomycetota bacterium]